MTQAFCHIVLHYSVARLSWKTIKSLRRSRSRHRRRQKCTSQNGPSPTQIRGTVVKNDNDAIEYEILQGWTIIAFHSLYVSLKIEYFVRFFIPFYFHLKMIVLLVTFVLPSYEYGLSPVISYWFDYLIVPGINKVHELMDNDPKGWAKKQIAMLPFLMIDFLIAPGMFTSEEEKQLARDRIRVVGSNNSNGEKDKYNIPPPEAFPQQISKLSPPMVLDEQQLSEAESESDSTEPMVLDDQHIGQQILEDDKTKVSDEPMVLDGPIVAEESNAAISQSTLEVPAATSNVSQQHDDSDEQTPQTPPRGISLEITPTRRSRISALTNNSMLSPVVRSRLASSAMKLKRFSREHPRKGGLLSSLSPKRTPHKQYESLDDELNVAINENERQPATRRTRSKRRERLSLGDHFRELVTGDANIRVRDHLFDLETDLPTSPRRHLRQPSKNGKRNDTLNGDLSPNVTTRRSSRLAKKRTS